VSAPAGMPAGLPARRGKPRVLPEAWTGITAPDCHECSWSFRNGVREVKYVNSACHVHYRAAQGPGAGKNED